MDKIINYGVILMLIAVISAGVLATVNEKTKDTIAQLDKNKEIAARKIVMPNADRFADDNKIEKEEMAFIPAYEENKKIGYVVSVVSHGGYAGDIGFLLGVDLKGEITGLEIIKSAETPGLGAKINNEEWQNLWIGRDKNYEFNKRVDGFAGATISPMAVYNGIQKALNTVENIR